MPNHRRRGEELRRRRAGGSGRSARSQEYVCRSRFVSGQISAPCTAGGRDRELARVGADRAVSHVRLEEERRAGFRPDGQIHLEQLVREPFEAVLRTAEVADVGRGRTAPAPERFLLLATERVPIADQTVL